MTLYGDTRLSGAAIDAAVKVHSLIGPGALENAYLQCLAIELSLQGFSVCQQVELPVVYRGVRVELAYRIDLLVEESLVVEVKAVSKLLPVHEAQLLSYLRLGNFEIGLLMNFHARRMKSGIKRFRNGFAPIRPAPGNGGGVAEAGGSSIRKDEARHGGHGDPTGSHGNPPP